MRLRFTPRATQDLIEIADYIRKRNPAASLQVRAAILNSLQNLVRFPEVGRRQRLGVYAKSSSENIHTSFITPSIRRPKKLSC
jgi:plasmid stabilization system protein ParE